MKGGIKIEGEKKVLGIIVGLIFVIIVILAILISINEGNTATQGNVVFAGDDQKTSMEIKDDAPKDVPVSGEAKDDGYVEYVYDYSDEYPDRAEPTVISRTQNVIMLSPFQLSESYERARSLLLGSQCYRLLGDTREITYYTGLVGTKFISNMIPSSDYSMFTAIVSVKLQDYRGTVFYEEYPVTIDLSKNMITKCKGRRITMQDLMP